MKRCSFFYSFFYSFSLSFLLFFYSFFTLFTLFYSFFLLVDDDGFPDYLDLDSDSDGALDADEGTSDSDGDGVANWRDSNNQIATAGGVVAVKTDSSNNAPTDDEDLSNSNSTSLESHCSEDIFQFQVSKWCWWLWLLLLLFLLILCCCLFFCLFCYRQHNRPRIFVRLHQAGKMGKTKQDEKILTIYVDNEHDSMFSVMLKLCDHAKLPKSVANSLKFQKTLGLYHGGLQCSIDQDHHLSDYNVEPLKSNVAPGKNKKQKVLRMEYAILDILDNMQSNPMAEYSPRTKISIMSRMNANPANHHADHAATLNDNNKINQLLKTGIGSMAQMIIPGSNNNNEGVSKWSS